MSFLHGVLESVKDDDNVITYNNYIKSSNNNDDLHTVLQHLHSSIGQGRSVFGDKIQEVDGRTEDLKKELGKLANERIHDSINFVAEKSGVKLQEQLANWQHTLTSISNTVEHIETDYVNVVDNPLSTQIMHEIKPIEMAVELLEESAKNKALIKAVEETVETFDSTRRNVDETVRMESDKVTKALQKKIADLIKHNSDEIKDTELKVVDDVDAFFVRAESRARLHMTNLEKEYKTQIREAHSALVTAKEKLENHKGKDNKLYRAIIDLEERFDKLQGKGKYTATGRLDTTENAIKKALEEFAQQSHLVHGELTSIRKPLEAWLSNVWQFAVVEDDVTADIETFVKQYRTVHEKLDSIKQVVQPMNVSLPANIRIMTPMSQSALEGFFEGVTQALQSIPSKLKVDMETLKKTLKVPMEKFIDTITYTYVIQDLLKGYPPFVESAFDAVNKALDPNAGSTSNNIFHGYSVANEEFMRSLKDHMEEINGMIKSVEKDITTLKTQSTDTNDPDRILHGLVGSLPKNMTSLTKQIDSIVEKIKQADISLVGTVQKANQLHEALTQEHTAMFGEKFSDLKDQIKALNIGGVIVGLGEAVRDVNMRLKELEQVPEDVKKAKKNAESLKETLKQEITNLRDEIKQTVTGRMHALTKNVKDVLTYAQTDAEEFIAKLSDAYRKRLKEGIDALEKQVHIMFAQQHKADLESLKKLVILQKERIGRCISDDKITGLKGLFTLLNKKLPELNKNDLKSLTSTFQYLYDQMHRYVKYQIDGVDDEDPASQSQTPHPLADLLVSVTSKVDRLFSRLEISNHFNYEFRDNLHALGCALQAFTPAKFGGPCTVLLDVVKDGLQALAGQLGNAYVNSYSGLRYKDADDTKYSKIFMTVVPKVVTDLTDLRVDCNGKCRARKIYASSQGSENILGDYFTNYGYKVSTGKDLQDGEVRNNGDQLAGIHIASMLGPHSAKLFKSTKRGDNSGILYDLYDYFVQYNKVGHISKFTSKKHPCSVNDMLVWYAGLPYNSVYLDLMSDSFSDLFDKAEKKRSEDVKADELTVEKLNDRSLKAYPRDVTYSDIHEAITHITSYSHQLLTTIRGHGDEYTTYASDLSNNTLGLYYPSSAGDCLSMFVDILGRLIHPLKYLKTQCSMSTKHSGWRDCFYGRDIKSSISQCIDHSSDQAMCQPTCQVNGQPKCQPTSPLMSYLNDCLPGHLPHEVTSIGCRARCSTCTKSTPGMPCLTPLGFRAFSGSTKTGYALCKSIREFLRSEYLSALFCALPKPPSTLPQHLSFVLSLVHEWQNSGNHLLRKWIHSSIHDATIHLETNGLELTKALRNAYGADYNCHTRTEHCDVRSVTTLGICRKNNSEIYTCAPYLSTVCSDMYKLLAKKHCNLYLSWAVYLPWAFLEYLERLLDAIKEIFCSEWGCRKCLNSDTCKRGKHGDDEHLCNCITIVHCRGVAPTLYKYGFNFGDPRELNDISYPRKCSDLVSQLKKVVKSGLFTELFDECDNFLCTIRWPFMQTLLALWSLSLLYLLHIAVVRLDVLRIRSHLRSPSSHRIAAQSLLAAARVKALANVKYFSP
ncbi:hypothetical protein, conserved [Babesia ovata]|uniref:C3H1-type domain-containing protein n=1 Tax=Babesia ovata TaxID=189622 RepID=A0A2H6KAD5_9APIC|nr:uncharacterized protein BOVATA_014540 [Babesia ovata]GBE59961.1 hypothetical protein, conserved [Babesia ovata]